MSTFGLGFDEGEFRRVHKGMKGKEMILLAKYISYTKK